jgi:hypothetical protein
MKTILVFLGLIVCSLTFAQTDSLTQKDTVHSVKKAVIFSSIIPCSGQIYNHIYFEKGAKGRNNVYWKLPLFYGILGFAVNNLIQNQSLQKELKDEYNYRIANNNATLYSTYQNYDNQGIVSLTKEYESKRDRAILLLGAAYFIQVVDAGIEAHFVRFDISEDLSLQFRPKVLPNYTMGFGINLKFN